MALPHNITPYVSPRTCTHPRWVASGRLAERCACCHIGKELHMEIRDEQQQSRISELETALFEIVKMSPTMTRAIIKAQRIAYDALPLHMLQQLEGDDE